MSDGNKRGGSSGRVAIGSCRVGDGVCEGISECRDRKGDVCLRREIAVVETRVEM